MQNLLEGNWTAAIEPPRANLPDGTRGLAISTITMFDLLQTLQTTARDLRARWDREFGASVPGLNAMRAHMMVQIAEAGAVPQAHLAKRAGITQMMSTRLLDDLEQAGWVKRDPSPTDRRAHAVRLTTEGRRALVAIHAAAGEFTRRNLSGSNEHQVHALVDALAALNDEASP